MAKLAVLCGMLLTSGTVVGFYSHGTAVSSVGWLSGGSGRSHCRMGLAKSCPEEVGRPWWIASRGARRGTMGVSGPLMMGKEEDIDRLKFEASQQRSRASQKGVDERARKELLRREIAELERSREAIVSKVKELFNRLQADPRAAKASAGTSAESVVAKNPEFRKCEERIGQLKGELASLMSWGVSSLAAKEGGGEAARDLAAQLEARPVLVLPGGILGEHLAQAAVERRFLSPEELKKVELDLPFAGKEWRQTEEGARLRRIMANIMREFEGSIVEAAKDQIPVDFPGIASPGQPLHPQGRADAIFEELRHILLLCQYATATGTPSFTDPEACAVLRQLLREEGIPPVVLASCVGAMKRRACFLGKLSREAPECWPACVPAFERCAEVFEGM